MGSSFFFFFLMLEIWKFRKETGEEFLFMGVVILVEDLVEGLMVLIVEELFKLIEWKDLKLVVEFMVFRIFKLLVLEMIENLGQNRLRNQVMLLGNQCFDKI